MSKQQRWRFGVGQSAQEERREIAQALADGRAEDYLRGQACATLIEQETARRRARHSPAKQVTLDSQPREVRLPTPEEIEARKSARGGWTRSTLARWGVPWPPPKGWRRDLERMRLGEIERPARWSGPVSTGEAA